MHLHLNMRAQELPMSTIVVVALGLLLFLLVGAVVLNIGGLGERFNLFHPSESMVDACERYCVQSNGFSDLSTTPYCKNDCENYGVDCYVYDENGSVHDLKVECP